MVGKRVEMVKTRTLDKDLNQMQIQVRNQIQDQIRDQIQYQISWKLWDDIRDQLWDVVYVQVNLGAEAHIRYWVRDELKW